MRKAQEKALSCPAPGGLLPGGRPAGAVESSPAGEFAAEDRGKGWACGRSSWTREGTLSEEDRG